MNELGLGWICLSQIKIEFKKTKNQPKQVIIFIPYLFFIEKIHLPTSLELSSFNTNKEKVNSN